VVTHDDGAPGSETRGHGTSLVGPLNELRCVLEDGDAIVEEHRIVREELELGLGCAERGGIRGMAVDYRPHIGSKSVDPGVKSCLQVHLRRVVGVVCGQVQGDDVARFNFVETESFALDIRGVFARNPSAHVAEREIRVPFECEDSARPRHLLAQCLRPDGHSYRRSVGGYSGYGNPKTITTSSSPVLATACQVPGGMKSASPCSTQPCRVEGS